MVRLQLCVHYTFKNKLEREIFPEQKKAHPLSMAALHRPEEATEPFLSHVCSHSFRSPREFPRFHCISSISLIMGETSPGARSVWELTPTCSCELIL